MNYCMNFENITYIQGDFYNNKYVVRYKIWNKIWFYVLTSGHLGPLLCIVIENRRWNYL